MNNLLNVFRAIFKHAKTDLLHLCLLGLISGIFAAIVIVLFRFLIEQAQSHFLPNNNPENYEALAWYLIFLLPLAGGILLGAIFHFIPAEHRQVGVVHTLEHLKYHNGRLPLINFLAQFIGAAISIIFGHSVGREGPSVHLGAGSGSFVAYLLNLPDSTRRILLACGAAAAIAASFNTPLAGVIFALEVILLEYTVRSMMPIIIASLTATLISRAVFGSEAELVSPVFDSLSLAETPAIIINGLIIGLISVAFIRLLLATTSKSKNFPIFWRLTLAGGLTGLFGLAAPEILSLGYDTLTASFHNQLAITALLSILIFKLLATAIGLGLGLPGGLIGPTLVIGGVAGALVGTVMQFIFPESTTSPGLYAMIGMGAMMGATLQAPLAALMAIFELTLNPHIILPGLITIVVASLMASEILKQPSIFISLMRARTKSDEQDQVLLSTLAEEHKLNQQFIIIPDQCPADILRQAIAQKCQWLVMMKNHKPVLLSVASLNYDSFSDQNIVNLNDSQFLQLSSQFVADSISFEQATEQFNDSEIAALCVQTEIDGHKTILGILSREDMSNYVASSKYQPSF